MMKGPPIDQIVYDFMFPKPKTTDPQNFQGLLQRHLVAEVRLETQAFYGHLSSQEAKYPGLDYSYRPHRVRLSRYPWHRRLFRALDHLALTESEIAALTKWEGTRWAKERYEREQGIVIRDTTSDSIADWVEPELRVPAAPHPLRVDVEDMEDVQEDVEEEDNDMGNDGEDSDTEIHSVGIELNERLRAAVALREAGNSATVMDEEWEEWLKDAVEAGDLPLLSSELGLSPNANLPGTRPVHHHSRVPLNATRPGQYQHLPDVLQGHSRLHLETNTPESRTRTTLSSNSAPPYLHRTGLTPLIRATPSIYQTRLSARESFIRQPIQPLRPSNTGRSTLGITTTRPREQDSNA